MKYVIFGSGNLAKEIISYAEEDGHEIVAVVSTQPFNNEIYSQKYSVITKLEKGMYPDAEFIMAVADSEVKKIFVEQNENRWGNFIHSSCHVSSYAKLGIGITMCPYSTITGDAVVGNFVTLNIYSSVTHDNVVGDFVTYSLYCGTMGNCEIGDECFFGTASYCIPGIKLGKKIKVSAGSVVRHSYSDECVLLGNPAKPRISSRIIPTQRSLDLTRYISDTMEGNTFHHHYHILYDIANTFNSDETVKFLEIGAYAGASACLMLQRKNTSVTSIDIGNPIPKSVVMNNVAKFNIHNNDYRYIQGNSHLESTHKNLIGKYDIIFIDGDHSFNGVIADFQIYSKYLKDGGYIVFDDYNDSVHSPEVKPAVDRIVEILDKNEYLVIGTLSNTLGARGFSNGLTDGNCFIIKKVKLK